MSEQTMCYAARKAGETGFHAMCVDDPKWASDTAQTVAEWIKDGHEVARVSLEEARAGLAIWMGSRQ